MKVLAIIPSFYGSSGDAVNERQLVIALSRKVNRCYVITFPSLREAFRTKYIKKAYPLPKNVITFELPMPHRSLITTFTRITYSYLLSIIGLILRLHKKVDLVYIRDSLLACGFLIFKSFANKTVVKIATITEEEIRVRSIIKSIVEKISSVSDKLALVKANKIAANSRLFYSELARKRNFEPNEKFLLLPPGVDMNIIKKIRMQKKAIGKNDLIKVGFLGSLNWWQGADILAEAMSTVKKKNQNVKLIIIGDGPLRKRIKQLCETSAIAYEITGFLRHEDALNRLLLLDVMVLPRKRTHATETIIPIKVLEAWALGVPVIVTKHKVFVESGIKNMRHVVYCEPEPSDVARAILLILKNKGIRDKLSRIGPKLAEKFMYDKIVDRLLKVAEPYA